ncbi:hypothetical protein HDU76_004676 [Blyttiomyces sp. JEL0837]|nr:hypothetical protein HDU76_004676 [Blyttiomyces sp. JEL0837]
MVAEVPWPLRSLVLSIIQRKIRKDLWAGGSARHSSEERLEMADQYIEALSALLGLDDFMMGTEEPTTLDCAAYGLLANMLLCDLPENECSRKLRASPNLVRFVRRMTEGWFKEFAGYVDWDQLEENAKELEAAQAEFVEQKHTADGLVEFEEHDEITDEITAVVDNGQE